MIFDVYLRVDDVIWIKGVLGGTENGLLSEQALGFDGGRR
jgi:hypothetical protein